jgi:hypothetical protein
MTDGGNKKRQQQQAIKQVEINWDSFKIKNPESQ